MGMSSAAIKKAVSPRAFAQGMGIVCLLYAGIAGWLWMQRDATIARVESELPQQTTLIVRAEKPKPPDVAEMYGPPAPGTVTAMPEPVVSAEPDAPPAGPNVEYMESGLAKAPVAGMEEQSPYGPLPQIRGDDRLRPFDAYRRPYRPAIGGAPMIAIAVIDVGLSDSEGMNVLNDLPPDMSVSVSPYAKAPEYWIMESRKAGHEVWMTLPVESADYPLSDPGPQTLLINGIEKQNMTKLYWTLSRGTGYVGVITGREPAFIKSLNDMRPVLNDVYTRGLGFIDGDIQPSAVPATMAVGMDAPYASASLWIDATQTPEGVNSALAELERRAANTGHAIGFVRASPLTIQALKSWSGGLQAKGLTLAPLSAIARGAQ